VSIAAVIREAVDRSVPDEGAGHGRALAAFRAAVSSGVSLVDRTSFEFMRTLGISRAYALDANFESEDFEEAYLGPLS
jgi:predicted nucleic acid-binding protein